MRFTTWIVLSMALACGGTSSPSGHFGATLSAADETPPTSSTATGTADYVVTGAGIVYTINYTGLTSAPSGAHIHVGATGVAGGVVVPFKGLPTGTSGTFTGTIIPTDVKAGTNGTTTIGAGNIDDLINALKTGNAYTNIHTTANPNGEIRGQIAPK